MQHSQRNRTGAIAAILVVLGLVVGLGLGLLLSWVVWPVGFVHTSIADLSPEQKDDYMLLVASAYASDGDLVKAQDRLAQLDVPNVNQSLVVLIDRYMLEGLGKEEIHLLASLADSLGVASPKMVAYLATPTPLPTDTPIPTPTPQPTDTPTPTQVPPTATPVPPADTPQPQATDAPPTPTHTAVPPTNTPRPRATDTPRPQPTNTPKPTSPPAPSWAWNAQLMGPANEPGQSCESGAQYVRVTVVNAQGGQLGGVWLHDYYSGATQVTGHKGEDPYWGVGEAEIPCPGNGGARICIAGDQNGSCVSGYTRDMSCYYAPSFEDLWAAGYCECCEKPITKERCLEFYNSGAQCMQQARHYSWRVVFTRSW